MKNTKYEYPQIDLKKTGAWLRALCKHYGYSVRNLQDYLQISSNQAIYEWFNGHTLPSVNNLLALSSLFNISMNSLLVDNVHNMVIYDNKDLRTDSTYKRCKCYYLLLMDNIIRMEKNEIKAD